MHPKTLKLSNRLAATLCGLCTAAFLCGCVQETPATFQAGSGANPLNGGVISDDGRTMQMNLTPDGTALASVMINGGESTIEFGPPAGGVAVPREITTGGGNSSLAVDRDTEVATIQANLPVVGVVSIEDTIPDDLTVTREFLLPESRGGAQAVDCQTIVNSVHEFCDLYEENRDASLEEVTAFAIDIADREGFGSASGVISSTIEEYYEVLDVFCTAFKELIEPAEGDPVDLCGA